MPAGLHCEYCLWRECFQDVTYRDKVLFHYQGAGKEMYRGRSIPFSNIISQQTNALAVFHFLQDHWEPSQERCCFAELNIPLADLKNIYFFLSQLTRLPCNSVCILFSRGANQWHCLLAKRAIRVNTGQAL